MILLPIVNIKYKACIYFDHICEWLLLKALISWYKNHKIEIHNRFSKCIWRVFIIVNLTFRCKYILFTIYTRLSFISFFHSMFRVISNMFLQFVKKDFLIQQTSQNISFLNRIEKHLTFKSSIVIVHSAISFDLLCKATV